MSGLKKLRSEKLGELERIAEAIAGFEGSTSKIEALVGHIDGVLADIVPGLDLTSIKPVRSRHIAGKSRKSESGHAGAGCVPVTKSVLRLLARKIPR